MENKQHLINGLILFAIALIVRIGIIALYDFDGLYGQDAFAYFDFAQDIIYFAETGNAPPPFFWSIGYPAQLAIGFAIFGASELTALNLSIIMGSFLPVLVYVLGLQLNLRSAYAFFAGLLMVFSGQALQSSLVIMSDIPALFWSLLSIITLLRYIAGHKRRWLVLCAVCVSIAALTRFVYLTMLPVYGLMLLSHWRHRIRWLDLLAAAIIGFIPIIPQLIFNQVNPTLLLNHSWVQGWSPLNIFGQNFVNIDGTFHYEKINALFYTYPMYDVSYLSPLLTLFVFIGIIALIYQKYWIPTLLLLSWIGLPYLFIAGVPYQNIRFSLIFFPAITLLIGISLQFIVDSSHKIRWILAIVCLIGLAHTALTGIDYAKSFVEKHQSEKAIVGWLADKVPSDATLYTFGSTLTLEHYADYNLIEIFYESPNTLNQRWFRGRADYLLLNIWQIENQWQDRDPQANYHWFRDERGLTKIDKLGNLTLFEASE